MNLQTVAVFQIVSGLHLTPLHNRTALVGVHINLLNLLVTGCTNKLNIVTIVRSAHTLFMCFVFI
jgi:Ni,Fe-hydrogenase I cytochrome b subunit